MIYLIVERLTGHNNSFWLYFIGTLPLFVWFKRKLDSKPISQKPKKGWMIFFAICGILVLIMGIVLLVTINMPPIRGETSFLSSFKGLGAAFSFALFMSIAMIVVGCISLLIAFLKWRQIKKLSK